MHDQVTDVQVVLASVGHGAGRGSVFGLNLFIFFFISVSSCP